jgi:hypothetical protein
MWMVMTIALVWGNEVRFMSLVEKLIGMWDALAWE